MRVRRPGGESCRRGRCAGRAGAPVGPGGHGAEDSFFYHLPVGGSVAAAFHGVRHSALGIP